MLIAVKSKRFAVTGYKRMFVILIIKTLGSGFKCSTFDYCDPDISNNIIRKISNFYCLACEAEARHMYCFSSVVVVVVVVVVSVGGVNFFVFRSFSRKLKGLEP